MAVDLEQMMILLQKRYNTLKRIDELTDELRNAFARHDEVSASLLLEMRAEEMAEVDTCIGQIWDLAGAGGDSVREVRRLMTEDPFTAPASKSWEENKIFEVRQKTITLLKQLQDKDRRMNLSVGGDRSYYKKKQEQKEELTI